MAWNPVDILLVVIVLVGALTGWMRGFVFSALDLLTLVASLAAAFIGYREVGAFVERAAPSAGVWIAPLSFVGLFLLVHLVLGTAVLRMALRLPQRAHHNLLNRLLGVLPGLVNGAMHAVVAAVLLLSLPLGARIGSWSQASALAPRFAAPAEWVEVQLAPIFDPALQRTLQALTVQPESRARIDLPFRVARAPARSDLESRMLDMVTAERRSAGLMHSPGHRANILRPQFGRLGIGILDGGSHGLMVTQAFRN